MWSKGKNTKAPWNRSEAMTPGRTEIFYLKRNKQKKKTINRMEVGEEGGGGRVGIWMNI